MGADVEGRGFTLDRKKSALLVVDVQERLWAVMRERQQLAERIGIAVRGCRLLQVPVFLTEQYPRGLGSTIAPLREALGELQPLVKMTFSCCGLTELPRALKQRGIAQVILAGIEAHVCVLQTALDLIAGGFGVHLLADAVTSRHPVDEQIALRRLSRQGVILSTVETALFELMTTAEDPEFKEISKLIK
jgi:nicotinamidase-related amidase